MMISKEKNGTGDEANKSFGLGQNLGQIVKCSCPYKTIFSCLSTIHLAYDSPSSLCQPNKASLGSMCPQ